ncbi:MAG: hypothetical protein QM820_47185 [Minicystis sp.]
MRIFMEEDLSHYLERHLAHAKADLDRRQGEALLNADEASLIEHLVSAHRVERLLMHFDEMYADPPRYEMIPAEDFPQGRGFSVRRGESYRKPVLRFHIPIEGNVELLRCGAGGFQMWSCEVTVRGDDLSFEFVCFSDHEEGLRRLNDEAMGVRRNMQQEFSRHDGAVVAFNERLRREITELVRRRRSEAGAHAKMVEEMLSVPIRRTAVPATLTVPVTKKPLVVSPVAPAKPREKGWFLGDDVYREILKLIYEWGMVMERHPSTYAGKDEEALRDLFLLLLTPHFQYTGGETFNKQGKTDILIRHEKHNVFVAECKVWHGPEEFFRAVDQLLGYLTWRDSKAALLMFVRNANIQNIISKIEPTIRSHPCFLGFRGKSREGWLDFDLRLSPQSDRTVKCAVMLLHLEEVKEGPSPDGGGAPPPKAKRTVKAKKMAG